MAIDWAREVRFFPTLRGYRRRWLARDAMAGVTFGAVTIPGQLATAHLAGMPPITGLYGFLIACVLGAAIASNRHIAFGVDSTVAPILAAGIAGLGLVAETPEYVGHVLVATFLVGVLILVVGIGTMGWVGDFLARPVVIGFLGGIAVIIVVNQIPGLLGLPSGSGRPVARLIDVVEQAGLVNPIAVVIGAASLIALFSLARVSRRMPGALLVIVVATASVTLFDLTERGVQVLGPLKQGLPSFVLPPLTIETMEAVGGTAVVIALICLAQTAAVSRSAAAIGGFTTDINADFRALGAGNLASSVFGSFTIDASPPSTTIVADSRGRTQMTHLVAAVMVIGLLFASTLAANLPQATLSAVLVYIASKIFHLDEMRETRRYSGAAFGLMLITLLGVVLLGIVYGLALALIVSIINRAGRTARPELIRLGRTEDGSWLPVHDDRADRVPEVAAFALNGPLWFGNANWFKELMIAAIPEGPDKPHVLVIDASFMDDIDFTGSTALLEVAEICELRSVRLAIVVAKTRTARMFDRGGLAQRLGESIFFDSLPEAVSGVRVAEPVVGATGADATNTRESGTTSGSASAS